MKPLKLTRRERGIERALLKGEYVDVSKLDLVRMTQAVGRRKSKAMEQDREALMRISKRLTPEQRLEAHLRLSKLAYEVYQAGVRHRRRMAQTERSFFLKKMRSARKAHQKGKTRSLQDFLASPADEAWLFKNKRALVLVRQGLEDAKKDRLVGAVKTAEKQIKQGKVISWTKVKRRHRL